MKVLFLCGGVGKRMFPLTEDKFLLKFLGKTLLEHQIDMAMQSGFRQFIIVANPANLTRIESITARYQSAGFEFAVQQKPLGIANTLESARQLLKDELLIVNPNDVFESAAYANLLASCQKGKAETYITGYKVKSYFPGGYLVTNEQGELTGIVEKPGEGNEPSGLVNILVHLHTDPEALLGYISRVRTQEDDVYERAINMMCKDRCSVRVVPYTGNWTPIKYPWHVLDVVRHFLDKTETHISPNAHISPHSVIDGRVIIEDGVQVLEHAVIRGPVYIGQNTVIGNNTLVRSYSHVGSGCVVGFATEIKGSYIGDGTQFHMNYAGDSVIGERCSFGAGTIIANWRLDAKTIRVKIGETMIDTGRDKLGAFIGDNCGTGINVGIMPGIRVGNNALIGPGVYLKGDVAADTMVHTQFQTNTIKKSRTADSHQKLPEE
jgi:UDP-N-acetylglucosamine diphosphorylase / glucose-1-phosphate thymidylyltransferase / UDP-N-acetylgalactosamine diphosphorylase / glucosamine-1-phosphate N-acetyltransferase / galactosamine-1-phosphate N-acetyltransferase